MEHDLEVKLVDGGFFRIELPSGKNSRIRFLLDASAKNFIEHPSEKFLTHMIEEFDGFGSIKIKIGAIERPQFSSYALFSDKNEVFKEGDPYSENFARLILSDSCFRTVAGPEAVEQYDCYFSLYELLKKDFDLDISTIQSLSEELSFIEWEDDQDTIHSVNIDLLARTLQVRGFEALKELYSRMTIFQRTAIHGLFAMNGCGSFVCPLVYVAGKLSKNNYVSVMSGASLIRSGVFGDVSDTDHKEFFSELKLQLQIVDEFIELGDVELFERKKADEVAQVLFKDESKFHEYKASFRNVYPTPPEKKVDEKGQISFDVGKEKFKSMKEIEKMVQGWSLKSIVGFLNSQGGTLVIGVHERARNNTLVGIGFDGFLDRDDYERALLQAIINRIGAEFARDFIQIKFIAYQGKEFCIVEILPIDFKKSGSVVAWLDDKECYARNGARTDKIEPGKQLTDFMKKRMSS